MTHPTPEHDPARSRNAKPRPAGEPDTHTRRTIMSRDMDREIQSLLAELGRVTGSKVDASVLTRAFWSLALEHRDEVIRQVEDQNISTRPAKRKGVDTTAYERKWALALEAACIFTALGTLGRFGRGERPREVRLAEGVTGERPAS